MKTNDSFNNVTRSFQWLAEGSQQCPPISRSFYLCWKVSCRVDNGFLSEFICILLVLRSYLYHCTMWLNEINELHGLFRSFNIHLNMFQHDPIVHLLSAWSYFSHYFFLSLSFHNHLYLTIFLPPFLYLNHYIQFSSILFSRSFVATASWKRKVNPYKTRCHRKSVCVPFFF